MSAWEYYARLMATAFKKTASVADFKAKTAVFTVATFAIGWVILYFASSEEEAWKKGVEIVCIPILGAILAFCAVYFFCFAMAPYHAHLEEQDAHKTRMEKLTTEAASTHAEILSRIDSLKAERDEAISGHAILSAKIEAKLATVADIAEEFRMQSRRCYKAIQRPQNMHQKQSDGLLGYTRKLVQLALRPTHAEGLETRIKNMNSPIPAARPLYEVTACKEFLDGWDGKLNESHINPNCTQAKLAELIETATH